MKKKAESRRGGEMRADYDFSSGVRGKYARRFAAESNVVVLDPDVARVFGSGEAVNRALRALAEVANQNVSRRRKRA